MTNFSSRLARLEGSTAQVDTVGVVYLCSEDGAATGDPVRVVRPAETRNADPFHASIIGGPELSRRETENAVDFVSRVGRLKHLVDRGLPWEGSDDVG